jgi:hypothetical protein
MIEQRVEDEEEDEEPPMKVAKPAKKAAWLEDEDEEEDEPKVAPSKRTANKVDVTKSADDLASALDTWADEDD